jgi:signal transduction histidine kinase
MSFRMLTKPHTGTGLLRQFAVLSLIVISLTATALAVVFSYYLRRDLLEREWRLTADYTRTEVLHGLTPADFDAPMTGQARERFEKLYRMMVMMPEIVRVKIYDSTMKVVWSDEPRLIGQRFPDNRDLVSALEGRRPTVTLEIERKGENIYEPDEAGHIVEVYVPIVFPGTTRVAGVVETYKLPEQVFANIRRGQLLIAGTSLAGGIVLYLSLFSIVRVVARRLESQRALTARLQAVHEEERAAIAYEAREQLAQLLVALKIDLAGLAASPPEQPGVLRARANEMLTLLDDAMKSALQIAGDMRPGLLENVGLGAALDWEAQRFQARTGIECQFTSRLEEPDLDLARRTVVFRVFQEALANAARRAGATHITVDLEDESGRLLLIVEDNGRTITGREIADPESLGLLTMRDDAFELGGKLLISNAPGRGTRVTLTVPLKRVKG